MIKKHPEIMKVEADWKRVKALKQRDKSKYGEPDFFLTLPNETDAAKQDRRDGFIKGFINLTTGLLKAKGDTIFKKEIQRKSPTAMQQAFIERADRSGQSLQTMMKNEVSPSLAAYGTVVAIIDKPAQVDATLEQELESGVPYLTILDPEQLIDFDYDEDGSLNAIQYFVNLPLGPRDLTKIGKKWKGDQVIATWTRDFYMLRKGNMQPIPEFPDRPNPFKFVPAVVESMYAEPDQTIGKSTFFESSDYLIMGNNLNSAGNLEVFKNSAATLRMHVQDWAEDVVQHEKDPDSNLKKLKVQAEDVKNVLLFQDPDARPDYLARDLALIEHASKRAQYYFDLACENEKRELSPETLKQPESGVSKGYDFAETNGMLASFASALEGFENQALSMVALMSGGDSGRIVTYPQDFDVRDFNERINFVKGLKGIGYASKTGMREAQKTLTPDITQDEDMQKVIDQEIDADPMTPPEETKKEEFNGNT